MQRIRRFIKLSSAKPLNTPPNPQTLQRGYGVVWFILSGLGPAVQSTARGKKPDDPGSKLKLRFNLKKAELFWKSG